MTIGRPLTDLRIATTNKKMKSGNPTGNLTCTADIYNKKWGKPRNSIIVNGISMKARFCFLFKYCKLVFNEKKITVTQSLKP